MRAKPLAVVWCILHLMLSGIAAYAGQSGATAPPSAVKPAPAVQWQAMPEDPSTWRKEPFKKLEQEKTGNPSPGNAPQDVDTDLQLQGIMKSNRKYYAIVNGRTVQSGDRIEGWTVRGINRHQLSLVRDKEKRIYDIFQGRIDRGAK